MNIYDNIKKICKDKCLSISSLENQAGLSNGSISKWQQKSPKVDNLAKVASVLDVSIEFILNGTESADKSFYTGFTLKDLNEKFQMLDEMERQIIFGRICEMLYNKRFSGGDTPKNQSLE